MTDDPLCRPAADDLWLAKWAPRCPDGNPQRLLEILGFRLRGPDFLQLRVVMRSGDNGVCQAIADERPHRIYVRALACLNVEGGKGSAGPDEETDWPCNIRLDAPLGERIVIDVDTGDELPLFIPRRSFDEDSFYTPRPPGPAWPPDDLDELF